jgi:hypothetical protein
MIHSPIGLGFRYWVILGITAAIIGGSSWAQEAGEPSLDQLLEDVLVEVAGIPDPSTRLFWTRFVAEADVGHGGRRLEERLVSILEPTLQEVPEGRRASAMSYVAVTLAIYGRTSEMLAVMRDLDDAWNYGSGVLEILVNDGDVATALILAEREGDAASRFRALCVIVQALGRVGEVERARPIFADARSIFDTLSGFSEQSATGHLAAGLAYFDPRAAERMVLGMKETSVDRNSAIMELIRTLADLDPARAMWLASQVSDANYRVFAASAVIRATDGNPDQRAIHEQALMMTDPIGRALSLRSTAKRDLANGDLASASVALDRLDAMLPELSDDDRARVADRVAIRLAIELLSNEVEQVFERMASLNYGDDLSEPTVAWVLASALRNNGYSDLGHRVAETARGTTTYPRYLLDVFNARFD